jgi:hypothetical protein
VFGGLYLPHKIRPSTHIIKGNLVAANPDLNALLKNSWELIRRPLHVTFIHFWDSFVRHKFKWWWFCFISDESLNHFAREALSSFLWIYYVLRILNSVRNKNRGIFATACNLFQTWFSFLYDVGWDRHLSTRQAHHHDLHAVHNGRYRCAPRSTVSSTRLSSRPGHPRGQEHEHTHTTWTGSRTEIP